MTKTTDYLLALDIGTSYVKALLAERGKTLSIIGAARIAQEPGAISSGAVTDIAAVVKSCERAIAGAEKLAGLDLTNIQTVIGIAGELVIGITRTIKLHRANPRSPITAEEMTKIVKKVEQLAGQHARDTIAEQTNNPNTEVRLVNSAIVNLYIDGHKVVSPVGFKGNLIAVEIYTAFAPLVHVSALEKVADELSLDLLAISVESFAVTRALLGDDPDSTDTLIVIDVGGGTTDIAVVDDGGVQGTETFSLGGESFTRKISTALGIDQLAAERIKLFSSDPRLDPAIKQKLDQAIATTTSVWLSGVEVALENFKNIESLPLKILLCGGGSSLIEIPEILATSNWYESHPFYRRPVVNLIDPNDIPGIINKTKFTLDHSFITALGLLRIALDTIEIPQGNGLRAKFARLLSR